MRKRKIIAIATLIVVIVLSATAVLFTSCDGKGNRERKYPESWSDDSVFSLDYFPSLEKKKGEPFRIVLFTDIQLWMNENVNNETFALMDKLVEQSDPDLIVLPGDNVSGMSTNIMIDQLIRKMESYGVPWAPVFGNHDDEGVLSIEAQAEKYEQAANCMFESGPENLYGKGNYAINITEKGKIIQTLFFFDNGRYIKYEDGQTKEVYISEEQIGWYEWTVKGVAEAEGQTVPSMTFSHFAMPQFRTAIETLCEQGEDGYYYVPEELGFGYCKYLPGVAPVDSGFFAKVKELGSTTHIFCGHDHENNASILYEGVGFTYGLKTGPSPEPWNDADYYGATVIEIGENVKVYNIEE